MQMMQIRRLEVYILASADIQYIYIKLCQYQIVSLFDSRSDTI